MINIAKNYLQKAKKHSLLVSIAIILILFFIERDVASKANLPIILSFMVASSFLLIYLACKKKLTWGNSIYFVFFYALFARLFFMYSLTPTDGFQHDLHISGGGHFDNIHYIMNNWRLPDTFEGTFFHTQFHYVIMAIAGKFAELIKHNPERMMQSVVLAMHFGLFYVVKKTMELYTKNARAIFFAVVAFAFFPINIFMAAFINNDGTYLFFSVLALYYLLKWVKGNQSRDALFLGLFTGLAYASKATAYNLLATAFVVAIAAVISAIKKKEKIMGRLWHFGLFLIPFAVIIGLCFLHDYRIGQPFFYQFPMDRGVFHNLYRFNFWRLFENPTDGGESLFECLFSTSLFGQYGQFSHQWNLWLAQILIVFGLLYMLIWVISSVVAICHKEKINITYPLFVYYIFTLLMMISFIKVSPASWNQHFRYIIPAGFVYAITIGLGLDKIKNKYIKYTFEIILVCLAIIASIYYCNISNVAG